MIWWTECGGLLSVGWGDRSLAEDSKAPGGGCGDPGVRVVHRGRLESFEGLACGQATLLQIADWGRCRGSAGGG